MRWFLELPTRPWFWALLMALGLLATSGVVHGAPRCPGAPVELFDAQLPDGVERHRFEDGLGAFVRLWRSGRRPELPVAPRRVTVYAVPGKPYIVSYERGGCVVGFLAVHRAVLRRWLGRELGWPT